MEPGSDEYKKFFAEVAKSYNEEVEYENLHRANMLRNFGACILWIAGTIVAVWYKPFGKDMGNDPIWVTIVGSMVILVSVASCYNVHLKHKRKVRQLLQYRQQALNWKDGKFQQ